MPRITPSYLQYRHRIAEHANWQNKAYPTQQQQDEHMQQLAAQPGLNSSNIGRQQTARALVQLLSLLTAVQNRSIQPPVLEQSLDGCRDCREGKAGDKIARALLPHHRVERGAAVSRYIPAVIPLQHTVEDVHDFLPFPAVAPAAMPGPEMMHTFHDERITRQFFEEIVGRGIAEMTANGTGLSPVIFFFEKNTAGARTKRMAHSATQQLKEEAFSQYLANNCRIRTKTNQGHVVGDSLLVSSEYIRNPLRAAAEAMYKSENGIEPMSDWLVKFYEGVNIASDVVLGIFTFGAYPIIKYASAKGLRIVGHAVNGDETCLNNEFSPEEMATLFFDTEVGLTHRQGLADMVSHPKPAELTNVRPFQADGVFVHEQVSAKLNTVKHMKVSYQGKEYLIKEGRPGEYYSYDPAASGPERLDRRVYFDHINNKIHFNSEMPAEQGLDYEVIDGKHFIMVQGEPYELKYNVKTNTPELVLNKQNGETAFVPVYMEPLSKTWHLSTRNGYSVFKPVEKEMLSRIAVEKNEKYNYISYQNNNPAYYGTGRVYRAEKKGDTSHYPWGIYVEMNGKLLPVREKVIPEHGVRYVIHDERYYDELGFPIEWDGSRWLLERPNSMHVSRNLVKSIRPDMLKNHIDATSLSAPDSYGLRWNGKEAYLKVKYHYVKVSKLNDNRFAIGATPYHHRMILRFKNNQFVVETWRERLDNLLRVGLNGRKRPYPVDVLKAQDGFTEESAKKLLDKYDFADNGLFSEYAFALEIEQTGQIPAWAERFKKKRLHIGSTSGVTKTITVLNPNWPGHRVKFHLGEKVGYGAFGEVFIDADDTRYVIKKYFDDEEKLFNSFDDARQEAEDFQVYYGEGSAQVLKGEDGSNYLRMYKVPGRTLKELPQNSLPEDAVQRFVDMLEKLNAVDIIDGELSVNNILWDADSQTFFPIDICNIKEKYFRSDLGEKTAMNVVGNIDWNAIVNMILEKSIKKGNKLIQ